MPTIANPPLWCRRRIVEAVLATLALAIVGVVASASSAQAHTDLLSSSPVAGSLNKAPPARVTLTFSEDIDLALSAVSLEVDGRSVGRLPVSRGSETGTVLAQVPSTELAAPERSNWTVGYRVTSIDGHPIAGTVEFAVAAVVPTSSNRSPPPTTPVPAADPSPSADSTSDAAASGDDVKNQSWWVPTMVLLLVVLGALAAFRLGRSPADEDEPTSPSATEHEPS